MVRRTACISTRSSSITTRRISSQCRLQAGGGGRGDMGCEKRPQLTLFYDVMNENSSTLFFYTMRRKPIIWTTRSKVQATFQLPGLSSGISWAHRIFYRRISMLSHICTVQFQAQRKLHETMHCMAYKARAERESVCVRGIFQAMASPLAFRRARFWDHAAS
jgi:hypothetical protein